MQRKIIYDISTYNSSICSLSKLTGVEEDEIERYIMINSSDYSFDSFLEEFSISDNQLFENEIFISSLHVTTNNDNCKSIQELGMINLQKALTYETPFKKYLLDKGVSFDLQKMELKYNGGIIDLSTESRMFPSDERESQYAFVVHKLFKDFQINSFLSYGNVLKYGGEVNERPEFLHNLSKFLRRDDIQEDWKESTECYVIKFLVSFSDFETSTFANISEEDYVSEWEFELSKRKQLIEKTLANIYEGFFYQAQREFYGYLKPEVIVPYSNIIRIYSTAEYMEEYNEWIEF